MTAEDDRLVRLTEICSSLPEATREYNGQHATFRVRRRTFAYYLDDHQGDGILGVVFKAAWGEHEALVASDAARFYRAPYLGHKGWVGLRLDAGRIDWAEVADLVTDSYLLVAPKRLAELVQAAGACPGRYSTRPSAVTDAPSARRRSRTRNWNADHAPRPAFRSR